MVGRGGAGGDRIQRLPDALIDQIAAGEVVERPASVVKELVENALDAGARRLRLELRGGGRDWIAVTDDGCGMTPEDARLALERHATSKLTGPRDLAHIATFGFRGEALPAIAAVSTLRLRTRSAGAPSGFEVCSHAGGRRQEREVGAPEGTRVEVAELFGNVPARRKFLKTVATEWGHAADWIARAGLALPEVHFDVSRDDRPAWVWPAVRDPFERVAAVLGEREAEALVGVEYEEGRVRAWGWVSRPDHHRGNLAGVYLFVNRRSVRDPVLRRALLDSYRDVLPRGRFPSAVLFLDVPFQAVDVNVHPAKWEVRFADPQAARRWVRAAVRGAFESRRWLGEGRAAPTAAPPPRTRAPGSPSGETGRPPTSDWLFAAPEPVREEGEATAPADDRRGVPAPSRTRFAEFRLLGQLLATYLVLEGKDHLLLVDQHAAHERVLYEQLRSAWLEGGVARQGLLAPATVQLDPRGVAVLGDRLEEARRLGFELEPFGDDTIAVRTIPSLLAGRDPAGLVRSLADELSSGGSVVGEGADVRMLEGADRIFATLACHSARRKGDPMSPREQGALLDALDAIPWAPTCPHGRPVAVPLPASEIERRFGRR